jgi:phosphotransferase system enzyme I (PtsI)
MKLEGIAASPGIAIGPAYIYEPFEAAAKEGFFVPGNEEQESIRLEQALKAADGELEKLALSLGESGQGKIFLSHRQLLWDEEIIELARRMVTAEHKTPEWAVFSAFGESIDLLAGLDDPVISARAADLADVRRRLMRILAGRTERGLDSLPGPVIVVAEDIPPSDAAALDAGRILGIVTGTGGAGSHTAIIANSRHLPAVLGVKGCTSLIQNGQTLCVDACDGTVFVDPQNELLRTMEKKRAAWQTKTVEEARYLAAPARFSDGESFEVGLNIGGPDDSEVYRHVDFVGLFRTEFLYMENNRLPDEEDQYHAYVRVLEHAKGKPVTLRTLDIGGDKNLPYMELPREDNPFLGMRALRLCMERPKLFKTQLRAAMRASAYGELLIMFPMVSHIEDFINAKKIYDETHAELEAQNFTIGDVKLGIMIEVPSIAMAADLIAAKVDFASIGTNDLCQYLCAADRMNSNVARYYQPLSPAMARLLEHVMRAFRSAGKPVSVCGEMAADPLGALLLAGLGLRKFSVSESKVAFLKALLAKHSRETLKVAALRAVNAATQDEVVELLKAVR